MSFKNPCSSLFHVGGKVSTPYGNGVITKFRSNDGIYEIDLEYSARLFTMTPGSNNFMIDKMEFTAAFEAYEFKRKVEFELICKDAGITPESIDLTKCTTCILLHKAEGVEVPTSVFNSSFLSPILNKQCSPLSKVHSNTEASPISRISNMKNPFDTVSIPTFSVKHETSEEIETNNLAHKLESNDKLHNLKNEHDVKPTFSSHFFGIFQEDSKIESATADQNKSRLEAPSDDIPSLTIPLLGTFLFPEEKFKQDVEEEGESEPQDTPKNNTSWFSNILGNQDSALNTNANLSSNESRNRNVQMSPLEISTTLLPSWFGNVPSSQERKVDSDVNQTSSDKRELNNSFEIQSVFQSSFFFGKESTPDDKPKPSLEAPSTDTSSLPPDIPIELDLFMCELIFGKEKASEEVKKSPGDSNALAKICLLCGSPTCSKHCSPDFYKEKICLCMQCVNFLEFDFDIPPELNAKVNLAMKLNHLVNLYDRALLFLKCYYQEMVEIINYLEESMKQTNTIVAGGSSVGVVSGMLGVAAACTALTPVGPPLLMASLVFGGSAVAVHSGSEALRYFSAPHDVADQIIALHGMMHNICSKLQCMRELTLDPYLDEAMIHLSIVDKEEESQSLPTFKDSSFKYTRHSGNHAKRNAAILTARVGTVSKGTTFSRFVAKTSPHLSRGAHMMKFAGGALSAFTLVLEARILTNTIDQIQKGSPCEKAELLRNIQKEFSAFLPTNAIDSICQSFLKVRQLHEKSTKILPEQLNSSDQCQLEEKLEENVFMENIFLVDEVISSLELKHKPFPMSNNSKPNRDALLLTKTSLLERIRRYKEREMAEKEKSNAETEDTI